MSPRLLLPSVSRITTLDFVGESFIRLTAFANPKPIAVPSSIIPNLTEWKRLTSTAWSVVSGHCVKLSPANTTRPIWSFGRESTNSVATALAASKRLGLRSSPSMVPEISNAIIISIPSVLSDCQRLLSCGRASANESKAIAATRNTMGTCISHTRQLLGCSIRLSVEDNCTVARVRCSFHIYHPTTGTSSKSRNKYPGFANVIIFTIGQSTIYDLIISCHLFGKGSFFDEGICATQTLLILIGRSRPLRELH